ncbi:hypothetical protein DBR06_SOUSAS6110091, partial [Sousa chinensis]
MGNGMNKILSGLYIGNFKDAREEQDDTHSCRLRGEGCLVHCLAGVSRSVSLVVAYIMTVTDFGWEDALCTVHAGRSCANPNLGFQRQLQEFEEHQVHHFRQWLKEEYGESPLRDAEETRGILATPGILKVPPRLQAMALNQVSLGGPGGSGLICGCPVDPDSRVYSCALQLFPPHLALDYFKACVMSTELNTTQAS